MAVADISFPVHGTTGRNGAIDVMRFAGALGIVWFHMNLPGGWITYAALPVFVTLLVYFGDGRSMQERADRMLIPWLLWSAVYGVAKLGDVYLGSSFGAEFSGWMVFTGTALHLWFLPFSFMFLMVARYLPRPIWVLALVASTVAIWAANTYDLPIPLAQWSFVLPAAFLGLLLRDVENTPLLAGCVMFYAGAMFMIGWPVVVIQSTIAALAVILLLVFPTPATRLTSRLSDIALPLYLIHPLMVAIAERIDILGTSLIRFVFVICASLVATLALERVAPIMVGKRRR